MSDSVAKRLVYRMKAFTERLERGELEDLVIRRVVVKAKPKAKTRGKTRRPRK